MVALGGEEGADARDIVEGELPARGDCWALWRDAEGRNKGLKLENCVTRRMVTSTDLGKLGGVQADGK